MTKLGVRKVKGADGKVGYGITLEGKWLFWYYCTLEQAANVCSNLQKYDSVVIHANIYLRQPKELCDLHLP